jgi:hypothetical protein
MALTWEEWEKLYMPTPDEKHSVIYIEHFEAVLDTWVFKSDYLPGIK